MLLVGDAEVVAVEGSAGAGVVGRYGNADSLKTTCREVMTRLVERSKHR